jgi:predicted Zn-dependent protease
MINLMYIRAYQMKLLLVAAFCCVAGCSTGFSLSAEKCFEKGKQKLKENKMALSYKYFDAASRKEPANVTFQWAAATTAPNQNAAFIHTDAAWKNGLKRPEVLLALSRLSFHTEKKKARDYAFNLFSQLPDSFQTPMLRSEIFYQYEEFDSCLSIALPLFRRGPTQNLCRYIAGIYEKKGDRSKSKSFLQDCRKNRLLDGSGYVMLASIAALDYDYRLVDSCFAECKRYGLYSSNVRLEQCGFFIVQGQYDDAEKSYDELLALAGDSSMGLVGLRARIGLAYIYSVRKQPEKIASLVKAVSGDETPGRKAESGFYTALLNAMNDSAGAIDGLRRAQRQLPGNPFVTLIVARENLKKSRFPDAIAEYKTLSAVFLLSPGPLVEYAMALDRDGKSDEAMALISSFHGHHAFTRQSLELFRDIAFKKRMVEKSMAAQKVLQFKYNTDASVLFSGAVLALKLGRTDSALALVTSLARKYPREEKFELAKISILLIKKQYEEVLSECRKSSVPVSARAPFEARAYRALGKNFSADSVYTAGLAQAKTPALMLEYANFLLESDAPERAASLYDEILTVKKDDLKQDSIGNSMLLNNLAWSLLQSKTNSFEKAIDLAKQAFELAPKNPHIIDTYAFALIKAGKYKDCVELLSGNQIALREPRLLFHLAIALQKSNQINKAVRYYQDVLKLMDSSSNTLGFTVSKPEIQATVEKLTASNK